MKIFGTDISRKFISFKTKDGEVYSIDFDYSLIKGITKVRFSKAEKFLRTDDNGKPNYHGGFFSKPIEIEVINSYPNLLKLIKEIWTMIVIEFSNSKRKIKKRKSSTPNRWKTLMKIIVIWL